MTQEPKPVKREIRFAWHLPKTERREDYHFVRENITYEDGGELPYYESDTFEYVRSDHYDALIADGVHLFTIQDRDERVCYDFYLTDHNVLIEFHGVQHYRYTEFFHRTRDQFEYRKICDAAKVDLAKLWKIPLLILNYRLLEVTEEEAESVLLRLIERKRNKRSPFKEQGKCAIR